MDGRLEINTVVNLQSNGFLFQVRDVTSFGGWGSPFVKDAYLRLLVNEAGTQQWHITCHLGRFLTSVPFIIWRALHVVTSY